MKFDAEFYRSPLGLKVYRRRFRPEGAATAGAVFVHGLGEHSGRHDRHLQLFAQQGIQCVAIDLPGHGLSDGPRGHITSMEVVMNLIHENVENLRTEVGTDRQIGLLGHSMGGFFSLCYFTHFPNAIDFSWISSPLIDPASKVSWLKRSLATMIERLHPQFTLRSGVTSHLCKRDEAEIAATRADDLVHRQMTVRLGAILVNAARALQQSAHQMHPELKLLMTHGGEDLICPPAFSRAFFDRLPCQGKEYALFQGLLHEPFNDIGKEDFYERLESWIIDLGPSLGESSLYARNAQILGNAA